MMFFTMDRDKAGWGVDPELTSRATEIAGCDAYAFPTAASTYDWFGQEFYYDLLHSFKNQPVFNSENHVIPDGSPPSHIPMALTRAAIWQGALHHQGATTIWVWEEAVDASLSGSIYFRPANIYGAARAMLDLNQFAVQVASIDRGPAPVALLYSPASVFWEDKYKATLSSIYTMLTFSGLRPTFVSERQLAENPQPNFQCIIVPGASHVTDTTFEALSQFKGKLLLVGDDAMKWDEYHRARDRAALAPSVVQFKPDPKPGIAAAGLRKELAAAGVTLHDLMDASNSKPSWGVEYRVVADGPSTLIPMINLNAHAHTVRFTNPAWHRATDLLTGAEIDLASIHLEPSAPRLLRIGS